MNLPVGRFLERGIELSKANLRERFGKLFEEGFSGYLAITIDGFDGLEEGVLLLRVGKVMGSFFTFEKFNREFFGEDALKLFFNAAAAKFGVCDIVLLTPQQAELIVAFHVKSRIESFRKEDLPRLLQKEYSAELARQILSHEGVKEPSKLDIFKKLGLTTLGR